MRGNVRFVSDKEDDARSSVLVASPAKQASEINNPLVVASEYVIQTRHVPETKRSWESALSRPAF